MKPLRALAALSITLAVGAHAQALLEPGVSPGHATMPERTDAGRAPAGSSTTPGATSRGTGDTTGPAQAGARRAPGGAAGANEGRANVRGGNRDSVDDDVPAAPAVASCAECGVVKSIHQGKSSGQPMWMSTLGSGASGSSSARPRGVGVGDSSGTIVGQAVDKRTHRNGYDIVVLMDDGSTRIVHAEARPALSVGDKVKVAGRLVYLR